ncbi:ATP-binding protein [Enterobacter hormaechei]|uniref:ATP-binding protein n=2 Tax=Enterobacter hormaechei TaxID=158836 RepID=UPI000799150B|nr:ATP-binding protein [Enterobacter hormaechei]SAH44274.1 Predicted ATPase [Enterobacter hormaechei]HBL5319011.1 ATP-binding protein [Enterobacter hormaechei]HBL9033081.1 ATP-binding protein [Enterobacter hormaechei]HCR0047616.1 ATP-binding protein [Enterobacter hormaechei]
MDELNIGKVTQVKGTTVKAKINHDLYQSTYFHNGKILRGISINEFVLVRKGYQDIVGKIIGEEIVENFNIRIDDIEQKKYERFVELNILGYFFEGKFFSGIKYLPMINDRLYLISDDKISEIYSFSKSTKTPLINIGRSMLEELPINIPINGVFNSHIGIFGNTGSGKSNTLAKLYQSLINRIDNIELFSSKSKFVLIDFNGEYGTLESSFPELCQSIKLSTKKDGDKIHFGEKEFWDDELLSVLFSATEKTQKPFLTHLIKSKLKYDDDLGEYLKRTIKIMFGTNPHKETVNLLKSLIPYFEEGDQQKIIDELSLFTWHSGQDKYTHPDSWLDNTTEVLQHTQATYNSNFNVTSVFDEIAVRATLQLINSVSRNYVQYDHIYPLINKIIAMSSSLAKVIEISDAQQNNKPISIISLKECNQAIKKTIPMMIAKCSFLEHKSSDNKMESFHLIIDEAHNILSESSVREAETWKDYRLELFEEIIKEGRKFGYFVTISSQRPFDISPTIVSQLHNYFIHRLVNENDLYLLKNTLSTLDAASRTLIPTLPPGACIISGTAFHTPLLVQIDRLAEESAPQSDTLDLENLWDL